MTSALHGVIQTGRLMIFILLRDLHGAIFRILQQDRGLSRWIHQARRQSGMTCHRDSHGPDRGILDPITPVLGYGARTALSILAHKGDTPGRQYSVLERDCT